MRVHVHKCISRAAVASMIARMCGSFREEVCVCVCVRICKHIAGCCREHGFSCVWVFREEVCVYLCVCMCACM